MDRDELIAQLIASYRMELAALSDDELIAHFRMQRRMEDMSQKEWQQLNFNI